MHHLDGQAELAQRLGGDGARAARNRRPSPRRPDRVPGRPDPRAPGSSPSRTARPRMIASVASMWRRRCSLATRASTTASTSARGRGSWPANPDSISSKTAAAHTALLVRDTWTSLEGPMMVISLSSAPKPTPSAVMSLNTSRSTPLASLLVARPLKLRAGLRGKSHPEEALPAVSPRTSMVGTSSRVSVSRPARDLAEHSLARCEVGHGCRHDQHLGAAHVIAYGRSHLGGAFDRHDLVGLSGPGWVVMCTTSAPRR